MTRAMPGASPAYSSQPGPSSAALPTLVQPTLTLTGESSGLR
jgi:hypothetical protein